MQLQMFEAQEFLSVRNLYIEYILDSLTKNTIKIDLGIETVNKSTM